MKRFLTKLLVLALTVCVAGCALAPVGLRQYRLWRDAMAVTAYRDAVNALTDMECGALRSMAQRQNDSLGTVAVADPFSPGAPFEDSEAYSSLLDPAGNGVMAVLELPKTGETLPVYHGLGHASMDMRVGHMEGSSLPVGGTGSLCVLAARGSGWLPGPFAGIDRLLPGDCFYIRTLRDTLIYEVTQVVTERPEALAEAVRGSDECILVTTAPWSAEERRLLVYASRISRREAALRDDSQALHGWPSRLAFAAPVAAAGIALILLFEGIRRAARRRRAKRRRL